jgi:hypothetical protein
MPDAAPSFRPLFDRWARRVRARFALRETLRGAALGLVVGAAASAALWQTRHGALRPVGAAAGIVGGAVGLLLARRRRFSDGEVALYLDARLGARESIATAVELEKGAGSARGVILSQATEALAAATPAQVRAPLLRPSHAGLPLGAAALLLACLAPLPPAPASAKAPPGAGQVRLAQVEGLEKIIKLAELNARDEAQRARLKKMAEEAKRLRDKLREGVEKREAQADLAKLRDGLSAEKLSLGDGQERQGMESALGKLADNPDLANAKRDLGDRDLVSFDEEMAKLADKLEKGDRERALKTLEEAAEAARRNGAPGVAKALEEERRRLDEAGRKADKLRELAKELGSTMGEEGRQALRDFSEKGGLKERARLAEKLEEALSKLTPEERKKLAENLKKRMKAAPDDELGAAPSKRELEKLADQLDTPEGQKALEDELRRMAKEPPSSSEEGGRQRELGDAEGGAGDAERQMGGGTPVPIPVEGPGGKPGPGGAGKDGKGQDGKGEAQAGHSDTFGPGGHGEHKGLTGVIEGGGMKARSAAKMGKGRPMPGVVLGRSAGKAGETANLKGSGALGEAAPGEIGGVERSDVPEEYREQVGRYFQPK